MDTEWLNYALCILNAYFSQNSETHPSVEKDLSLKIEVRDQTIWTSTPEL